MSQQQTNEIESKSTVAHFMVRTPVVAEAGHTVGHARRQMLRNSFSNLPIFWDGKWRLLADMDMAKLFQSLDQAERSHVAATTLEEVLNRRNPLLNLGPAAIVDAEDDIKTLLNSDHPDLWLVVKAEKGDGFRQLVGVLSPFDLMKSTALAQMNSQPFPYAEVFTAVEQQVIALGMKRLPREQVTAELGKFKRLANRDITDAEYFELLVYVTFYSGFKAATVTRKKEVIKRNFPTWQVVAEYGEADIRRILSDPEMIANGRKVRACVANARTFRDLVGHYGSFNAFLDQHLPSDSFEDLMLLKELLQTTFAYLGGVTVYHFMTDIGLNVLKPDRVICRLFHRMGLLENESQFLKAIVEGRHFATAIGLPIRYIDIVLVSFGQVASPDLGIARGVCLNKPNCGACSVRLMCTFPASANGTTASTKSCR